MRNLSFSWPWSYTFEFKKKKSTNAVFRPLCCDSALYLSCTFRSNRLKRLHFIEMRLQFRRSQHPPAAEPFCRFNQSIPTRYDLNDQLIDELIASQPIPSDSLCFGEKCVLDSLLWRFAGQSVLTWLQVFPWCTVPVNLDVRILHISSANFVWLLEQNCYC